MTLQQALSDILRAGPYELCGMDAVHELFRLMQRPKSELRDAKLQAEATLRRVHSTVPTLDDERELQAIVGGVAAALQRAAVAKKKAKRDGRKKKGQ